VSSRKSVQRLQIECHHNPLLRALFLAFTLLAAACLCILPLSWPLTGFSLLLLLSLAWRTWRLRCELDGERVSLLWDAEGRWWWCQGSEETELLLAGDSYLSSWMIVLNLRDPATARGYSMLLFPTSIGADRFRRLTVRLRLEGRVSVQGGQEVADVE